MEQRTKQRLKRHAFWIALVFALAFLTDMVLGVEEMLGYATYSMGGRRAIIFGSPRDDFRSVLLIATLIGLGVAAAWTVRERRARRRIAIPGMILVTAFAFRIAETLTDALMISNICLGSPQFCANEAMELLGGDRFTIVAYLCLGAAIVLGGMRAHKVWRRLNAPPTAPAEVTSIARANEHPESETTASPTEPSLTAAPALT